VLRTRLLHPEILAALAGAGHGSRVLIADGNYPFSTGEQRVRASIMFTIGVVNPS
jgi:L-fucose mutarotase/ribose pyranase (RbsD/FucU family)